MTLGTSARFTPSAMTPCPLAPIDIPPGAWEGAPMPPLPPAENRRGMESQEEGSRRIRMVCIFSRAISHAINLCPVPYSKTLSGQLAIQNFPHRTHLLGGLRHARRREQSLHQPCYEQMAAPHNTQTHQLSTKNKYRRWRAFSDTPQGSGSDHPAAPCSCQPLLSHTRCRWWEGDALRVQHIPPQGRGGRVVPMCLLRGAPCVVWP